MATQDNEMSPSAGNVGSDIASDEFTSILQDRLMESAGAVSSFDTEIESSIGKAIKGVEKSRDASNARVESAYNREIGYTKGLGQRQFTAVQEDQRGYGMQVQALRSLTESTEKDVNDLEQRKQEAILMGDAEAAGKIADLQLKSLEFKQQSQQRVFENLITLGNFGLNVRSQNRADKELGLAERSQSFFERNTIATLASQYGVPVYEGDTIDTISQRIAPIASEKQKLELDSIRADINNANAQASKAYKEMQDSQLDPMAISIIAEKWDSLSADEQMVYLKNLTTKDAASLLSLRGVEQTRRTQEIRQILDEKKFETIDDAVNYFNSLEGYRFPDQKEITAAYVMYEAEAQGLDEEGLLSRFMGKGSGDKIGGDNIIANNVRGTANFLSKNKKGLQEAGLDTAAMPFGLTALRQFGKN